MQIKTIKKSLINKTLIILGMGIALLASAYYFYSQLQVLNDRRSLLKSGINALNRKLDGLNNKTLRFSEAVKIWDKFSEDRKSLQGLQISKAQSLVSDLKTKYNIIDLDFTFSKPTELSNDVSYGTSVVFVSDVNITFKAISDEYVLGFVDQLRKKIPGFINITSLVINKEGEVTKNIIERISKGEKSSLVSAKLEFKWYDIKYVETSTKDKVEPGGV